MRKSNKKEKFLAIIPARSGSKRILNKNIRIFNGKPLIYYTIKIAQDSKIFDRIIVDTDSSEIAKIARKFGAETPFLRPKELARSGVSTDTVIEHLLERLKQEEDYVPDTIALLQTTSPLRTVQDIVNCFSAVSNPKVQSVCTVSQVSPWFLHLTKDNKISVVNKNALESTQTEEVKKGYAFNGSMVYMIKTLAFLRTKKLFSDENTVGVVTKDAWRAVDLDYPEDWVLAEFLHANKEKIEKKLKSFK